MGSGRRVHLESQILLSIMTDIEFVDRFIDQAIYNGIAYRMGAGCQYRGTTVCYQCPFEPRAICDYHCQPCEHRGYCKCGWDQMTRLRAWGLV